MNRENPEDLTDLVHRAHDEEWLEQAAHNRHRQRRRRLSIGALVVVLVLVAGFLLYDGPRRSGMLDAMGITCGEYIVDAGASQEQIFEPWDDHEATLSNALRQRPEEQGEFDLSGFGNEVDAVASEMDVEPVHALFRGWTSPAQRLSAEAIDGALVVGHHDQVWTLTDRVSVADPESGQTRWTVELEHPLWEDWQAPERALYGVGAAGDRILLQTPAVNGDTDLVVLDTHDEQGQECVRFDGDVDPVEVLQDHPRAWPVMINLNLTRLSDTEFLVLHGLDGESGSPMLASEVDIDSHEVLLVGEYPEAYLPDTANSAVEAESVEVEAELSELQVEDIQPLGDAHYLLTWDAGYIILEQN